MMLVREYGRIPERGANPHQGAAYKQTGGGIEFCLGQPSAKYGWIDIL
jgi:hypothetical protein